MSQPPIEQRSLRLTAHPFQRAGAFVFAAAVSKATPLEVTPEEFDEITADHAEHAGDAAMVGSKDEGGFFQKQSFSLFPNSPMNHGSRFKKDVTPRDATKAWRTIPPQKGWPDATCALCGVRAVGFYGNSSIPLAASISHRNTTPAGHDGYPLCWPCTVSFFALPYACRLTGGHLSLLHSWDEAFLAMVVRSSNRTNRTHIALGTPLPPDGAKEKETALRHLRGYERPLTDGVDLLVFSNFNGSAELSTHHLDEPVAEWVRCTRTGPARRGFAALLTAHRRPSASGYAVLAANIFDQPHRVVTASARFAGSSAIGRREIPDVVPGLAAICRSYLTKVLFMDNKDAAELDHLAGNIATILMEDQRAGKLREFRNHLNNPRLARPMVEKWALEWTLNHAGKDEAMVSKRAMLLLFDRDHPTWLHRSYLLIAVLGVLHEQGWSAPDAAEIAEELSDEDIKPAPVDGDGDTEEDGN